MLPVFAHFVSFVVARNVYYSSEMSHQIVATSKTEFFSTLLTGPRHTEITDVACKLDLLNELCRVKTR